MSKNRDKEQDLDRKIIDTLIEIFKMRLEEEEEKKAEREAAIARGEEVEPEAEMGVREFYIYQMERPKGDLKE